MYESFRYIWNIIISFWDDLLGSMVDLFAEKSITPWHYTFNIYLFSNSGWLSEGIKILDLMIIILSILTFVFVFKLILKIIRLPFRIFK